MRRPINRQRFLPVLLVASAEFLAKTPDWESGLRLLGQPVVQARWLLVALEPGTRVD